MAHDTAKLRELLDVRIAVLIGSNGKVACAVADGDEDWGLMADCIMDWPPPGSKAEPKDPDQSVRYFVTVSVPKPIVQVVEGALISQAKGEGQHG